MIEESKELDSELEQEFDDRPAANRPDKRRCLSCGKLFASSGWGNRLCNDCRRRDGPPGF